MDSLKFIIGYLLLVFLGSIIGFYIGRWLYRITHPNETVN